MRRVLALAVLLFLPVVIILSAVKCFGLFSKELSLTYNRDDKVYDNPYTGYAPNAGYVRLAERCSLVYMGITWSELEPEEGVFAWDEVERRGNLPRWRAEGKNLVLRFICDFPGNKEHMDIPKWLYDKTGDGAFYDMAYGKGYCPDYNNEVFIKAHAKVVEEIGKHFSDDNFLAYVEMGSLGHWGEWHTYYPAGIPKMPITEVRERYVEAYVKAFPYAKLLMRRPFAELPSGAGLFNDMTGSPEDTEEWLSWIKDGDDHYTDTGETDAIRAMPDIWNSAPVGGEFTSRIPMSKMLGPDLDKTIALLDESHMTFIGPKMPDVISDESLTDAAEEVIKHVGYRYMVSSMKMKNIRGSKTKITVTMRNDGTAPLYFSYVPYLYIENEAASDTSKYELSIDLTKLTAGKEASATVVVPTGLLENDGTKIYAGIEDPDTGTPSVYLTMDAERNGKKSLLWER